MDSVTPLRPAVAAALVLFLGVGLGLPASAEPGEIKGQDVMGDKTKSAQDGWSQAPVPREESAAKDAPNPGGASMSNKGDTKGSETNNGPDDPQKPLDHRTPNPSGSDPASPSK